MIAEWCTFVATGSHSEGAPTTMEIDSQEMTKSSVWPPWRLHYGHVESIRLNQIYMYCKTHELQHYTYYPHGNLNHH